MHDQVTCWACGTAGPLSDGTRCDCGEPRWFVTDPSGFEWPADGVCGMWAFADLLPVAEPAGVGQCAGGTPLARVPTLDGFAGCRVFVKDETENPTGSFKDRGSAVAVSWAAAADRAWVGTVSHGNMARSVAAHATGHGLDCLVLVPTDIPAERLVHVARYDPTVVRVSGDYSRLYFDALDVGPDLGVEFVNSDTPLRVAGQKTAALEVLAAFAPEVPDALVLPTSSGGLASACWKALREVHATGLVESVPRLYLVQSAACDPIAAAYRAGTDRVSRVESGETVAYSIANADPPSGNRALAAARETGGAVISVPDDEILTAQRRFADAGGFCVEPASAAALAGLRRLTADGEIATDEQAVVVATGTGFTERAAPVQEDDVPTVDRADLAGRLAALVG